MVTRAAAPIALPPAAATPSAPELEEIIVDSLPPMAKIYVDGVAVADTPEAIKVQKGTTKTIVLKKDGFVDQSETIDPQKSRKVLVRLERVVKKRVAVGEKTATPIKLPVPPPEPTPDPPARPPVAHAPPAPPHPHAPPPAPPRKRYVDPYERVDEPKKGGDVLNPY
jgi:hypothetical protein